MKHSKQALFGAATLAAVLSASCLATAAEVRKDGSFAGDAPVTLDLDRVARRVAIDELAKAAGWSVVLPTEPSGDAVTLHVRDQDPGKILDAILAGDSTVPAYRVHRDKNLIVIDRDAEPKKAAKTTGDEDDARDRTVTGGSLRVEKGETVRDVTVMGGKADVLGTVTGDLAVIGGSAEVHPGGKVLGDATTFLGSLTVDDGAEVHGHTGVVGGRLHRSDRAKIGGLDQTSNPMTSSILSGPRRLFSGVGHALSSAALLFVFGAVLFALAPTRMERLQAEFAARPMRNFALGVVALIAAIAGTVALCMTIIGIPLAIVFILAAVVSGYGAACAVLATAGRAVLGHKTQNPYVHLAAGAVAFLALSSLPVVGGLVTGVVMCASLGVLWATKIGRAEHQRGASGYGEPALW